MESELLLTEKSTTWQAPKLTRLAPLASGPMQLIVKARGAISNLLLRPMRSTDSSSLPEHGAQIQVAAVGLNFRDVLNVLGEYPGDPGQPGLDCSGTVTAIDTSNITHLSPHERSFGFAFGSLASYATTDARLLVKRPPCVSAEHVTSLPITWSTVHVAFEVANLHAKQISMLHTTAGGVGLIALEYARLVGSIPHATAGGKTKHATIRLLNQEVVHSSRNGTAFACGALHHINSNRMHLILNSLSGDLTAVSFALLGEGSAFMEIGKRGVWSSSRVSTSCEANIHLGVLAIDDELSRKPSWMQRQLTTLAKRVINGVLHPYSCGL